MGVVQQASGLFNGTSFTAAFGAASSASNRVVLIVCGNTTVTTPSGFTLRASQVNFMGHYLFDAAGGGTSYAVTTAAGQGMWYLAEVAAGSFIGGSGQNDTSTGTTYSTPANTPTAGDRIVFATIGSTRGGNVARTISGWTNSFVEQADLCQTAGASDAPMGSVATLDVTANGSTAYSTTATYSASNEGRSALIASYATTSGGANLTANPADSEGLTDSLATINDAVRSQADPLGITDALTATRDADRTQADNIGLTDGLTATADVVRSPDDPLGLTDGLTVLWDRAVTVGDSLGLTDTATGAGAGVTADPLVMADSLTATADRERTIADGLGVTDAATSANDAVRSQADTLGTTDAVTDVQATDRPGADSAGLTDTLSAVYGMARDPADTAGFTDSLTVVWNRSVTIGDGLGLADTLTATGLETGLRDLLLAAVPLDHRFTAAAFVDRFMSAALAGRWSAVRLEGEPMHKEVLVSAGAVEYVGGTVTELTGKDISGATFMMSLGGPTNPGAWVAPTVSTAGDGNDSRVLKLLVNSSSPKGTFYAWARISDSPEVAPVRFPQEIIIR